MCEVDKNTPDVIYHYTNQDGLLGIIGNNTLWATNILYLNDYKEHIIGKELLDIVFKSSIEKIEVGTYEDKNIKTAQIEKKLGQIPCRDFS